MGLGKTLQALTLVWNLLKTGFLFLFTFYFYFIFFFIYFVFFLTICQK